MDSGGAGNSFCSLGAVYDVIEFTVPGEPMGKGRPRVTRYGTYTPTKTKVYEEAVKLCCRNVYKGEPKEGEIRAEIKAYFGIPKSRSKLQRRLALAGEVLPTKRPDCDNIAKIILDALNGIAYKDDSAVIELKVQKIYSSEPRVEVKIYSEKDN